MDFKTLVDLADSNVLQSFRPVIEKEVLHYEIFSVMHQHGLLKNLVFQGGTSLRLCRGSNRYSEDLDFAQGYDFKEHERELLKSALVEDIGERFNLPVKIKEPQNISNNTGVTVRTWQLQINTAPERADLPSQRINIEIADVPAHTKELAPIMVNYPALAPEYQGLSVYAQSMKEILADKLFALPACTSYVRHRDIWDIAWLVQQKTNVSQELLEHKISDYGMDKGAYLNALGERIKSLPDIIHSEQFIAQISRFIPLDVRQNTLNKEGFLEYLQSTVLAQLSEAEQLIQQQGHSCGFGM